MKCNKGWSASIFFESQVIVHKNNLITFSNNVKNLLIFIRIPM